MSHKALWTSVSLSALILALLPAASAGSPESPEIRDPEGDVDPLSVAGLTPQELEDVSTNLTMYDVVAAYVTAESREGFVLALKVVDLYPSVESPDPNVPSPPPPPTWGTYDLHFRTPGGPFLARAELDVYLAPPPSEPSPPEPPQVPPPVPPPTPPLPAIPYVNFSLHRDTLDPTNETWISNLAGYPIAQQDTLFFFVPKQLVGSPADGTTLDRFYAVTGHKGTPLDRAPDLALASGQLPGLPDPADPQLPATYGDPYLFGQYPLGAVQSLVLQTQGVASGSAEAGEELPFFYRIENKGTQSEKVIFLARLPRGWSATFDEPSVDLGPGSSRILGVTLTPTPDAARTGLFILKATSTSTGQTHEVSYTIQLEGGSEPASPGGPDPTGGPEQSLIESDDKKKDTPAIGLIALIGALAALAQNARRRR